MRIIIGLGNPGEQYLGTRHNLGFWALDAYAQRFPDALFKEESKFFAEIAVVERSGEKLLLVKPQTFMNDSGKTVRALVDFYKLNPADLLVLHDDLDLPLTGVRITDSASAAGHNGVADIIERLGTQDFARIRIGIGRPADVLGACMEGHAYVLGKLTEGEITAQNEKLPQIFEAIDNWLSR